MGAMFLFGQALCAKMLTYEHPNVWLPVHHSCKEDQVVLEGFKPIQVIFIV